MAQSIKSRKNGKVSKPPKPSDDFPLFAHASGRWAKKILGNLHYFGRWAKTENGSLVWDADIEATAKDALDQFNREFPFLREGKAVPSYVREGALSETRDFATIAEVCNSFWRNKREKLLAGELSERSFHDYVRTTDLIVAHFGKDRRADDLHPEEFERLRSQLAERLGPHALKNTINRCRVVFKFAHDSRMIDRPVNYGQSFARPSAKAMRKARREAGPKLLERDELLSVLAASDDQLKAMILLGLNCGYGNTDVSSLPKSALDLKEGWIDFPRPKTEIHRRAKLWPETVAALELAIAQRPAPEAPEDADLCFLTVRGKQWVRVQQKGGSDDELKFVHIDALTQKFGDILKRNRCPECGTLQRSASSGECESCKAIPDEWETIERKGISFYTLRHVFETVAGESRDQVSVNAVMGHLDSSMAATYRERISDERLEAVAETVREWLFFPAVAGKK